MEHTDPIRNIARRVSDMANEVGLSLQHFALIPSIDGGPDVVQAVFALESLKAIEALKDSGEQKMIDAQFEELVSMFKEQDLSDQKQKLLDDMNEMKKSLGNNDGIL